jgi:hypothetical protein
VRNILWLGTGHHFLVMRPLTLPVSHTHTGTYLPLGR